MTTSNPFGSPTENESDAAFEVEFDDNDNPYYVAEGDYTAKVVGVEQQVSKNGNPMWVWDFAILTRGDYEGKELRLFAVLTPQALFRLKETLVALGLMDESTKRVKFDQDKALNRRAVITVVDNVYQGRKNSSIQEVHAHPDGPIM
jgi:hypothetical protein